MKSNNFDLEDKLANCSIGDNNRLVVLKEFPSNMNQSTLKTKMQQNFGKVLNILVINNGGAGKKKQQTAFIYFQKAESAIKAHKAIAGESVIESMRESPKKQQIQVQPSVVNYQPSPQAKPIFVRIGRMPPVLVKDRLQSEISNIPGVHFIEVINDPYELGYLIGQLTFFEEKLANDCIINLKSRITFANTIIMIPKSSSALAQEFKSNVLPDIWIPNCLELKGFPKEYKEKDIEIFININLAPIGEISAVSINKHSTFVTFTTVENANMAFITVNGVGFGKQKGILMITYAKKILPNSSAIASEFGSQRKRRSSESERFIRIQSLKGEVTKNDLALALQKYGLIQEIQMYKNEFAENNLRKIGRGGDLIQYAIVFFAQREDAARAFIEGYEDQDLLKLRLHPFLSYQPFIYHSDLKQDASGKWLLGSNYTKISPILESIFPDTLHKVVLIVIIDAEQPFDPFSYAEQAKSITDDSKGKGGDKYAFCGLDPTKHGEIERTTR